MLTTFGVVGVTYLVVTGLSVVVIIAVAGGGGG